MLATQKAEQCMLEAAQHCIVQIVVLHYYMQLDIIHIVHVVRQVAVRI